MRASRRRVAVVEDPRFGDHCPPRSHPECPERLAAVRHALAERADLLDSMSPRAAEDHEILRVHRPSHLARISEAIRHAPAHLDPDTYLEIKREKQQFIRGSVRESEEDLGSYKAVAGVYYPYSLEAGVKNDPSQHAVITIEKIEVNVPIDDSDFKMPALKK